MEHWCADGCVVECRICNREFAGSNLSLGYIAPKSTQPSIPPGSVNEYQLREMSFRSGKLYAVWCCPAFRNGSKTQCRNSYGEGSDKIISVNCK